MAVCCNPEVDLVGLALVAHGWYSMGHTHQPQAKWFPKKTTSDNCQKKIIAISFSFDYLRTGICSCFFNSSSPRNHHPKTVSEDQQLHIGAKASSGEIPSSQWAHTKHGPNIGLNGPDLHGWFKHQNCGLSCWSTDLITNREFDQQSGPRPTCMGSNQKYSTILHIERRYLPLRQSNPHFIVSSRFLPLFGFIQRCYPWNNYRFNKGNHFHFSPQVADSDFNHYRFAWDTSDHIRWGPTNQYPNLFKHP